MFSEFKAHFRPLRIGVQPNTPINCASLQLDDIHKGLLLNRVTTAQRNAIVDPATSLVLFNTDNARFEYYDGSAWMPLATGGSGTVNSITANNGLSGGTITSTGTIGIAPIAGPGFLANASSSFAVPVSTTLTNMLDVIMGSTQGNLLYRSGFIWTALPPGTVGQVLTTGGTSANPSWVTPATIGGASPSVSIGLAAIDGSATTFMRSDAAPELDQSISPTWSGDHTFSNTVAMSSALNVTGTINSSASYQLSGYTVLSQPGGEGYNNLGVGLGTLVSTTGIDNTAVGQIAGAALTTGICNTAAGYASLAQNTVDFYNTAVGCQALQQLNSSDASSTENTAVGYGVLSYLNNGSNNTLNTVVGSLAMGTSAGASIQENTVIGANAGYKLTGSSNTILGSSVAYQTLTSGSKNILIGTSGYVDVPTASTSLYINIGLAMDGTSGEYLNTTNCGIRSLGYYGESSYGYANNAAFTVYNGCSTFIIDTTSPSGFALTAPLNPVDGQFLRIACGNNELSTFSFLANAGQIVNYSPSTLAANSGISYLYRAANSTWYKIS